MTSPTSSADRDPDSSADGPGELTYEQARAALEDVVRRLEAGGVPLEESLALWEQGEHLARQCQQWLDGARARMQAVQNGKGTTPDADDSETSSA
jgi:exodeoxyribonuclease VII small subunit